jgi:hypothetical protein
LHRCCLGIEGKEEGQRENKLDEGKEESDPPDGSPIFLVNEKENNGAQNWEENQQRQDWDTQDRHEPDSFFLNPSQPRLPTGGQALREGGVTSPFIKGG